MFLFLKMMKVLETEKLYLRLNYRSIRDEKRTIENSGYLYRIIVDSVVFHAVYHSVVGVDGRKYFCSDSFGNHHCGCNWERSATPVAEQEKKAFIASFFSCISIALQLSGYSVRLDFLIDFLYQSLEHVAGTRFNEGCRAVGDHALNGLRPFHGRR